MACPSKKNSNKPLNMKLVSIMSALLVLCSVGSIAGTYSWYEYNARAALNYHGTAVGKTNGMKVGLYSQYVLYEAGKYGLVRDPDIIKLYWAKDNSLTSEALMYYSKVNRFSANILQPVTSGKYENGDVLKLKTAPFALGNYKPDDYSDTRRFLNLPLVFKLEDAKKEEILTNERVVLSNVLVEGDGLIKNGLRIYFENSNGNCIFNPSELNSGYTTVGGVLDLDLDGFNDYKFNEKTQRVEEYYYGEHKSDLVYSENPSVEETPLPLLERDTFNGVTYGDVYCVDKEKTIPEIAQYAGINDVVGVRPLGKIDKVHNLIYLNTYVYAEGWSPFVSFTGIREVEHFFNLTMSFELGSE